MPHLNIYVPDDQVEVVQTFLAGLDGVSFTDVEFTDTDVVFTDHEGPVAIELLEEYYRGAYRNLPAVQELIAAGRQPIPADEISEDEWEEFANGFRLYEYDYINDHPNFNPQPLPHHDYARWTTEPATV